MIEVCIWAGTVAKLVRYFYSFRSRARADSFIDAAFSQGLNGQMVWYAATIDVR